MEERDGSSAVTPIRPPFDLEGPNARLAELVALLCECPAPAAMHAVEQSLPSQNEDKLAVGARAMVMVKHEIDLREATPRIA